MLCHLFNDIEMKVNFNKKYQIKLLVILKSKFIFHGKKMLHESNWKLPLV